MKGVSGLQPLDPFNSIDPLISWSNQVYDPPPVSESDVLPSFVTRQDIDSSDEEWDSTEHEFDGNIFDILDDET